VTKLSLTAFAVVGLCLFAQSAAAKPATERLAALAQTQRCEAPLDAHLCAGGRDGLVVFADALATGAPSAPADDSRVAVTAKAAAGTLAQPTRCGGALSAWYCASDTSGGNLVLFSADAGRPKQAAGEAGAESARTPESAGAGQVVFYTADSPMQPAMKSAAAPLGAGVETPYAVTVPVLNATSRPFSAANYLADGSFTINVANGSCTGTYTVNASPVAGSGPSGSTPPNTTVVTYIGFPQGNFAFNNAGAGDYTVTVTETSGCTFDAGVNPTVITVTVPQGDFDTPFAVSVFEQSDTSRPFAAGNYTADGSFRIEVADGNCAGTYTVNASPVAGSGPSGSTPPFTSVTTYIGFPQGTVYFFDNAGAGDYLVTTTQTNNNCAFDDGVNPTQITVTINQGPNDTPFAVSIFEQQDTSRPFAAGNYTADGSFRIEVADGNCAGTYTVNASPVAGSGPSGSTPPNTSVVTYIGFPQGTVYFFDNAGAGDYLVTTTQTNNNCAFDDGVNPTQITVTINQGPNDTPFVVGSTQTATSLPFLDPAYAANASFTMSVADGNCAGTYTVQSSPVAGSAPDGSNPPNTAVTAYIGFGAGSFLFDNAGVGQYNVTVTQTNANCVFDPGVNPFVTVITIVGPSPQLTLTPDAIDFGGLTLGTTSIIAVTFSSDGDARVFVSALSDPGAPFSIVGGTCGATPISIPVGESCTVEFQFAPEALGPAAAIVTVDSTAISSPDSLSLTGSGSMVPLPEPVAIPTLDRITLAILALLFALVAGWQIRRGA
jgi:hypothetical protein